MREIPILAAVLLLPATLEGCSGEPAADPSAESKPSRPDPRPEVYEPVYRVATELRAAQDVGMNRRRFGELLEKFATELALARDRAESPREQRIVQGYAEALQTYKDAAAIWDVKISIPELVDLADQHAKNGIASGSLDLLTQKTDFVFAAAEGIPLNFLGGGDTGISGLATRYQLPVTDSKGWKTVPNDSVERVRSRARAKTDEVVKMQKG